MPAGLPAVHTARGISRLEGSRSPAGRKPRADPAVAEGGRTPQNCAHAPGFARVIRVGNCMINSVMAKVAEKNQRTHPAFRPGDTIRVHVKIKEGDKERLQAFEGTVIARN